MRLAPPSTLLLALLLAALPRARVSQAQASRIVVDGEFGDWSDASLTHTDGTGDGAASGIDLGRLWVTNDEDRLFFRIEMGAEILIQESNQLILHLDTDNNAATGMAVHGVGAELSWTFGQRSGLFFQEAGTTQIRQAPLGIVTAPTVSGIVFEVSLDRNAAPDGLTALFAGETLRLVLEDAGGDRLPDALGGVSYTFQTTESLAQFEPIPLDRLQASDIRVLSYNVERDAVFSAPQLDPFKRILSAISPDIIGFQEISGHSAEETRSLVESALPSAAGQSWHSARIEPDLVVVSRFPVRQSYSIPGGRSGDANAAFLLDMQDTWGSDLLLVVAHPPCCRNDQDRQLDFDAMMAFVRDAKTPGGLELEHESPIMIVGDMNMVGLRRQLETLLEGDIVNSGRFGQALNPDWDGSPLADLAPPHVALPMTYTWYDESSSFHPGRLDFIVYTDSVLDPGNAYVLFTPAMSPDALAANGLEAGDATLASDHLPVIGDFRLTEAAGTASVSALPAHSFSLEKNYPNPFVTQTRIQFDLRVPGSVRLTVLDALGRQVEVLASGTRAAGSHNVSWNTAGAPSGIYFYRLEAAGQVLTRPMLLIR